jgi:glyoxylase-like metal-dependent hydrolase (beta-lactamase superfamily II)
VTLSLKLFEVGYCKHLECISLSGGGWRPITFPSLSALIVHPREGAILYDTGYSNHFMDATRRLPERLYRWLTPVTLPAAQCLSVQLARSGLSLSDIRYCVISHFHADHIAGLRDLDRALFIASRRDVEHLRGCSRLRGFLKGLLPALLPPDFNSRLRLAESYPLRSAPAGWSGLGEGYDLFGDGSILALRLPGHAPGHLGLLLRDADDRPVLLCADASWSRRAWQEQRLPSLLARSVIHDWNAYKTTLSHLQALAKLERELIILPSHCAASLGEYSREPSA